MKSFLKIIIVLILFSSKSWGQNAYGSKDCDSAPILCNNQVINDTLKGNPGDKGSTNDIPSSLNSCFKPKSERNPFWYKFTPQNSGTFEMYLNADFNQDFDWIIFDVTSGCAAKSALSCNRSQVDLDYDSIGTGLSSDSAAKYESDHPGTENPWGATLNVTAGKTYAIFIESQFISKGQFFQIKFGGTALFTNVISSFTSNVNTICQGGTVSFDASASFGTGTYKWDFGDGTSPITVGTNANQTHQYTTPGNYTVKLTVANSSCSSVSTQNITVNLGVGANAGIDQTICSGQSATLTAKDEGAGVTYTWNPGALSGKSVIVTPPVGTNTYTLRTQTAAGCFNTSTVKVNVNTLPVAAAGADQAICIGQSATLSTTAVAGVTYTWTPGPLSGASVTVTPPVGSNTYTLTAKDNVTTCQKTDDVIVKVSPLPNADAGTDQTICNGGSVNLSATPSSSALYDFVWSPATGLSGTTISNPIANPTTNTTYTIKITEKTTGCSKTDDVLINVNPLPAAAAGNDQSICSGQSATLSTTAVAGITYTWNPGGLTGASVTVSPGSTTPYTLTAKNTSTNCQNTDQVVITVNPLPNANAGADKIICENSSINLGATPASVSYDYLWTPSTGLNNSSISNPIANPTTTTTYTVKITEKATGCFKTDDVIITVNPKPTLDAGPDQTICLGDAATLTATGTGSFNWAPGGQTTQSITVNPLAGVTTYTVTLTDAQSCSNTDQVNVTVTPAPIADAGLPKTICAGQSVTINGSGTGTYSWSPGGQTTGSITVSPAVTTDYILTVTNSNCSASNTAKDTVTITVNALPNANAGADQNMCIGETITIQPAGNGSYAWTKTGSAAVLSSDSLTISPGTTTSYVLSVTGANGCTKKDTVTVNVNAKTVADAGGDQTICQKDSVTLTANGTGTYTWTPGGFTTRTIKVAPSSTTPYTLTVFNNNCTALKTATDVVTIIVNPTPVADAGKDTSICAGSSATLNGKGAGTYQWLNKGKVIANTSSFKISPLINTTYDLVVSNGTCSDTDHVTINVMPVPVINAGNDTTICQRDSITLKATGGVSYIWSPGLITGASIKVSPVNTQVYTVVGLGANGCANGDQVTVNVNTLPSIFGGNDTTICSGQSALLIAKGGVDYVWSPGATTNDSIVVNPLITSSFSVKGTDSKGCSNTDTVVISVNSLPIVDAGKNINTCLGGIDTLKASGGLVYSWSPVTDLSNPNIFNPVVSPSAKGTRKYIVKVKDANGCLASDSVNVTATVTLNDGSVSSTPTIFCPGQGATIKAASIGAVLGANPYSFNGGATYQTADTLVIPKILTDTIINVKIKDASGCTSDTIPLNLKKKNILAVAAQKNAVKCFGGSDGVGTITSLSGGIAPYIFSLDNGPSQTDSIFTGLSQGNHTITITDSEGCPVNSSFIVKQPSKISVNLTSQTNVLCGGDNSGAFSIKATGGTGSLLYSNNGGTSQNTGIFNNLVTGTYTVIVTDSVGCTANYGPVVLTEPTPIVLNSTQTDVACFGQSNGSITLSASGGIGGANNYLYSIDGINYTTNTTFTNLKAGSYTTSVKDANSCFKNLTVTIVEPADISASVNTLQNAQCNGNLGSIEIIGLPNYTYSINGGTISADTQYGNLLPGVYVLKIFEGGCSKITSFTMAGDDNSISADIISDSVSCHGGSDGSVKLTNLAGPGTPFEFKLIDSINYGTVSLFENLTQGQYTILARNTKNCVSSFTAIVNEPDSITILTTSYKPVTCYGDTDGVISFKAINGNGNFTYSLDNVIFSPSASYNKLPAYTDTLYVKDARNCFAKLIFEIKQPDTLKASITESLQANCNQKDGEAKISNITGGNGVYSFSIDTGIVYKTFTDPSFIKNLSVGQYGVRIKDAKNCMKDFKVTITIANGILLDSIKVTPKGPTCHITDGEISLSNIQGGTGSTPVTAAIDGGTFGTSGTNFTFKGLIDGNHAIQLKDAKGCMYPLNVSLSKYNFPVYTTLITEATCENANGSIRFINIESGIPPYKFSIDGGTFIDSGSFLNVKAGTHTISVKDNTPDPACTSTQTIVVPRKPAPIAYVSTEDVKCANGTDGKILIDSITGGVPFIDANGDKYYELSIDSVSSSKTFERTSSFDNLKAGVIKLYIKDQECENLGTDIYQVTENGISHIDTANYISIKQPVPIQADTFFIPTKEGSQYGSAGIHHLRGGIANYSYSISSAGPFTLNPPNNDTIIVSGLNEGNQKIYIKDSNGCIQPFDVKVDIPVFVPNLITPNSDTLNSYFVILSLPKNSSLSIYNKWGNRIYYNQNYDNTWGGESVPDGVYFYELNMPGEKERKGWVEIIRGK